MWVSVMKRTEQAAEPNTTGRFDKLFSLCEQEVRQSAITTRSLRKVVQNDQDETEAFRQAAIQSLLARPAF